MPKSGGICIQFEYLVIRSGVRNAYRKLRQVGSGMTWPFRTDVSLGSTQTEHLLVLVPAGAMIPMRDARSRLDFA